MMLTDDQYERIGRYLDGEKLLLSDAERTVAEQIRDDEAHVGDMLAVTAPAGLLERTGRCALVAEIRRDEAALAGLLDTPVPSGTLQRVQRRVVAELARPQRWLMRIGAAAASVAAAAAVLLILARPAAPPERGTDREVRHASRSLAVPVEVISASVEEPRDMAVDLLAEEIDHFQADLVAAAPPAALDMGIDHVEQALEELWLDLDEVLD